jgi:iron complex outermembrane recepter protein
MRKTFTKAVLTLGVVLLGFSMYAQTKLSGKITDAANGEGLGGVNIMVKGKVIGTTTQVGGGFTLLTSTPTPFTLVVTYVGYGTQEIAVTGSKSDFNIALKEQAIQGQEVVVSASRVEEKVMKSASSIEKMDIRAIQSTPAVNFYDALKNIKGVEVSTQSLTFTSVNTRGFNANGNVRMVQQIDGVDNQAPGLNFSVGNIVGISELDLESVELLPGASSALYGPNAINGILLMTSKSPFLYKGFSAAVKTGIMSESGRPVASTPFYDASFRWAKSFNDKFAMKVNFSYLQATDWAGTNYLNSNPVNGAPYTNTTQADDPNYNGVNAYGDETRTNIRTVANGMVAAGLLPAAAVGLVPNVNVSRTPYLEKDLVDYNTRSLKANIALHYRITEKAELIGQFNWGSGTSVYTGADRYSLQNFTLWTGKLELKGDNYYLRGYTTQENSGDSYAAGTTAQVMNELWKPSGVWFPTYVGAFVQAKSAGQSDAAAYNTARGVADASRPAPGSEAFNSIFNTAKSTPIPNGGKFLDATSLYHLEGMYNFKEKIKFADVLVGVNYRTYNLNSSGTIFADKNGRKISIAEYGAFAQISKSIGSMVRVTASGRYDKNENFDGQFTPRIAIVISPSEEHNFRFSYQTGFRIPTTQDQYIDLKVPQARLIGGLAEFRSTYNLESKATFSQQDVVAFQTAAGVAGAKAGAALQAELGTTAASIGAFLTKYGLPLTSTQAQITTFITNTAQLLGIQAAQQSPGLKTYTFEGNFKPESVACFEIGYKGIIDQRLFLDTYVYWNNYSNFSAGQVLLQSPSTSATPGTSISLAQMGTVLGEIGSNVYSLPVNVSGNTQIFGWAIGADYRLSKGYSIGGNVSYNQMKTYRDQTTDFNKALTGFNTPPYRVNLNVGNRNVGGSGFGFNVTWRYQEKFLWNSSFINTTPGADGTYQSIVPQFNTLDAQISKKLPSIKSILKIGANNIMGSSYFTSYGNPSIGSTFYLSLSFDELLNK